MTDNSKYIELLRQMIAIPSFSREEGMVADLVTDFLRGEGCEPERIGNNILVRENISLRESSHKPVLLLNSHLDTVRPVTSWTRDPFDAAVEGDRLFGLGSNDAGASVISLIADYLELRNEELPVRLDLALSCEEECSGEGGMRMLWPHLGQVDMAIVGEPTGMNAAVGERGLVVLDCVARGVSGHAARNEGVNAIYKALDDIARLRDVRFPEISGTLGDIKLTVTQIDAGYRHNVVPDTCKWVVDIRTTDAMTNEETVEFIRSLVSSEVTPRSTRIRASAIPTDHPLAAAALASGASAFNSPTTSDMALMPCATLKIGPGDSARSHSADEYILISEIEDAISRYKQIIRNIRNDQ